MQKNLNAKIATYFCLFTIIIVFLGLGYSSVTSVDHVEITPETKFVNTLLNCGNNIRINSNQLFKILTRIKNKDKKTGVIVQDNEGNIGEYSFYELAGNELKKINKKNSSTLQTISNAQENEFATKYNKALKNYNKSSVLLREITLEITDNIEYEEPEDIMISTADKLLRRMGDNNYRIKYYIRKAEENLKN